MKLSYYPGCSLLGTAFDYDKSVREICSGIGVELVEIPDWNCCGASSAHMTDHEVGIRLPMRNLLQNSALGLDILVPCAACYQRLKAADKALRADPRYWDVRDYSPGFSIIHISSFLARQDILELIRENSVTGLGEMPLACYYGCLSLRNPRITDAENWEQPKNLEKITSAMGGRPVSWSHRTECCSGSLTMTRPDIAEKLVGDIVGAARKAGASAMVTDCPMCQANVESRQQEDANAAMPVFFITELIAATLSGLYPAKQEKLHLVSAQVLTETMRSKATAREDSP
jgi:heterodisulfide reductase subunit B